MRLYVAGPMTGYPDSNYPAFNKAAVELAAVGHQVENPADHDDPTGQTTWRMYIRMGLAQLLLCDGVALLDGWEDSKGARLETQVAHALGMDVRPIAGWINPLRTME